MSVPNNSPFVLRYFVNTGVPIDQTASKADVPTKPGTPISPLAPVALTVPPLALTGAAASVDVQNDFNIQVGKVNEIINLLKASGLAT